MAGPGNSGFPLCILFISLFLNHGVSAVENYLGISATNTTISIIVNDIPRTLVGVDISLDGALVTSYQPRTFPPKGSIIYNMTGLSPGRPYDVQFLYYRSTSKEDEEYTTEITTRHSTVLNLKLRKVDRSSVLVTWDHPTGTIFQYGVGISPLGINVRIDSAPRENLGLFIPELYRDSYNITVLAYGVDQTITDLTAHVFPHRSNLSEYEQIKGMVQPKYAHKNGDVSITLDYGLLPYLTPTQNQKPESFQAFKGKQGTMELVFLQPGTDLFAICENTIWSDEQLTCIMGPVPQPDMIGVPLDAELRVTLTPPLEDADIQVAGVQFTYLDDPFITKIFPLYTVVRGGTTLTVTGDNLVLLQQPRMIYTLSCPSGDSFSIKAVCKQPEERSTMLCITPDFTSKINGSSCAYPQKGQPLNSSLSVNSQNFGLLPIPAAYSSLRVGSCPTVQQFSPEVRAFKPKWHYNERHIDIKGDNFLDAKDSIIISIGNEDCQFEKDEVNDNLIRCRPPQDEPISQGNAKGIQVVLSVGDCNLFIGYLDYWSLFDSPLVKGLIGGGAGLIILIICIFILCRVCRDRKMAQNARRDNRRREEYVHDADDYAPRDHYSSGTTCCCMPSTTEKYIHGEDPNYMGDIHKSSPRRHQSNPYAPRDGYLQPVPHKPHRY